MNAREWQQRDRASAVFRPVVLAEKDGREAVQGVEK